MQDERAVAVQYHRNLPAPLVIAKGKGHLATKLVEFAQASGVRVVNDATLAERLFFVETGQFIPEPFYHAVAEILALVFAVGQGPQDRGAEEVRP